jgi:hypothetical protein
MANRVSEGIAKAELMIGERLKSGLIKQSDFEELGENLNFDIAMHSDFQNRKSIAFMEGKLNQEEAQQLYMLVGETPATFNNQSVYVKIVVTHIYQTFFEGKN